MSDILIMQKLFNFELELELDNFREVISKTMEFLKSELSAENVHWFLGDRLENLMQVQRLNGRIQIPRMGLGEICPKYLSLKKSSQEELAGIISQLEKSIIEFHRDDVIEVKNSDKLYLHWPIFGPRTKEKIGDLLVESPQNWMKSWMRDGLSITRQVLGRNLMESVRFVRARELAFVDDLTGLFNQRYLSTTLDREISMARRQKTPFSILFLDIDHFKSVNDQFGHIIGSKILSQLGQLLRTSIRGNDVGIRYGGDEYLLVLVGANAQKAHVAAQRIRGIIEKKEFIIDGKGYKITTSIGVAAYPEHAESREKLINMADHAMYQSKNSGRNCIYIAD